MLKVPLPEALSEPPAAKVNSVPMAMTLSVAVVLPPKVVVGPLKVMFAPFKFEPEAWVVVPEKLTSPVKLAVPDKLVLPLKLPAAAFKIPPL